MDSSEKATGHGVRRLIKNLPPHLRLIFWGFFWLFTIGVIAILLQVNERFLVSVPKPGGSLTEGVIGRPAFINPVLAISDTDRDLSTLVYSGILRRTPDGTLLTDLAESVTVSADGLQYTVTLKPDATFHDGKHVTADDVLFTIRSIKDPLLKSPLRSSWEGVTTEKISDASVSFQLQEPYALFTQNLTVGILPEHIWRNFSVEDFINNSRNTNPIGSGPYKIRQVERSGDGIPRYYELEAFKSFALGRPYISTIELHFYTNEEALRKAFEEGDVQAYAGASPAWAGEQEQDGKTVVRFPLARIFAVFLNQNEAGIFTHKEVRRALDMAADKERIVEEVLAGYGTALANPVPHGLEISAKAPPRDLAGAKDLLVANDWKLGSDGVLEKQTGNRTEALSFSLATANVPELVAAAEILKESWNDIGAQVRINVFDLGDLNQEIIRPRKYQALLFGEVVGQDPDLFAFWHSSQRLDPGLNIAQYANIAADKRLEEARVQETRGERFETYLAFLEEIKKDMPAVFLYAPYYLYLLPENLHNVDAYPLTVNSERFNAIYTRHVRSDRVWSIFVNESP